MTPEITIMKVINRYVEKGLVFKNSFNPGTTTADPRDIRNYSRTTGYEVPLMKIIVILVVGACRWYSGLRSMPFAGLWEKKSKQGINSAFRRAYRSLFFAPRQNIMMKPAAETASNTGNGA